MKFVKVVNIILITLLLLLVAFDLLLVLPEYCACINATGGATVTTFWGYSLDCIGDTAEFSWIFFQLIGTIAITILVIIIIFFIITYREKSKRKFKPKFDE
ncbi:hypothetical protein U0035_02240 [Niabella yanshanensis]|uniref:Uncharacterized protein n=1 Tax=Niabella yanshanensis TaxID=577386 RepID=A0ABZ0W7N3_9BACT|nr:hypothetical protein [Niabella yanshanensis]WQD38964.1 hypothetical protein U0035_02240 [Niabella yanshanensis]